MNAVDLSMLVSIKGVGDASVLKFLTHPKLNRAVSLFDAPNLQLLSTVVTKRAIASIDEFSNKISEKRMAAEERIRALYTQGVSVISLFDDNYPKGLKALSSPPLLLYCQGDWRLMDDTYARAAVIGSRIPTVMGQQNADATTRALVKAHRVIVSGLALGVDAIAHKVTLELKGNTIAVVPDVVNIYPAVHKHLAQQIIQSGGLLVSENPPGVRFSKGLLVQRDRIQAALSQQIFAIESRQDGGTLHAVEVALALQLPLYVPKFIETGYVSLEEENIQGLIKYVNENIAVPYLPHQLTVE